MVTPLEIQNHGFRTRINGFDKEEVKQFLYALAEEFENLLEQNHKQAKEVSVLKARLKDMEARDKILKDTLISAQQIKQDAHENAVKEAELIVKEGRLKADAMVEDARSEVKTVNRQLHEVRRVRNDLLAEVEMMVTRFEHFVDAERHAAADSDKLLQFGVSRDEAAKAVGDNGSGPHPMPPIRRKH